MRSLLVNDPFPGRGIVRVLPISLFFVMPTRFFRRANGNTVTDFVKRLRVNRACHLPMESERLVAHICDEVGFNNVANSDRRFLEIKGMTPSEFRRQAERRFGGRRG